MYDIALAECVLVKPSNSIMGLQALLNIYEWVLCLTLQATLVRFTREIMRSRIICVGLHVA